MEQALVHLGGFFFSAAPTAQTSPEFHFRFINSFIQPSCVESLHFTYPTSPIFSPRTDFVE